MKKLLKNSQPDGIHFLIEFRGCDEKQIDKVLFWKKTLKDGANLSGISIINDHFYSFAPHGVTGFLLLASSHISVHTWPEYKYVACDIFSCSSKEKTKTLVNYLVEKVLYKKVSIREFKRGYKFFNFKKIISKNSELIIPIFSTGDSINIKIEKIIGKIKSDFQDILFLDTLDFGRCLVINGIIQTSDKDHAIYDKAILKPLKKKDRRLLILGGGDGYVAELALKLNPNLKIHIVDLDMEVIKGCERYLNQKIFKDKRVCVHIEDASFYLKKTAKDADKFDGIVCDLTDEPSNKNNQKDFSKFYEETISLSNIVLKKHGWISMQAGASKTVFEHLDAVSILSKILDKRFINVTRKDVLIPSFGEKNAFLYAKKK